MIEESQLAKFLSESGGNIAAAARAVGISRRQFHRRIEESEELQALLVDLRETVGDFAEDCIRKAIEGGDVKTSIWYLLSSSCGRSRGYSKHSDPASVFQSPDTAPIVEVVVDSSAEVAAIMDYKEFQKLRLCEQKMSSRNG